MQTIHRLCFKINEVCCNGISRPVLAMCRLSVFAVLPLTVDRLTADRLTVDRGHTVHRGCHCWHDVIAAIIMTQYTERINCSFEFHFGRAFQDQKNPELSVVSFVTRNFAMNTYHQITLTLSFCDLTVNSCALQSIGQNSREHDIKYGFK